MISRILTARQETGTGPIDLLYHVQRVISQLGPDRFYGPDFHLSDIEDLYYAVCGKTKDLRQCAELHLRNGFTKPDAPYIRCGQVGSSNLRSILLKDFLAAMAAQEAILYSSDIVDPLDKAVLQKNMRVVLEGQNDRVLRMKAALEAQGLEDMHGMSCAMIFAALSEKYRAVEADERAQKENMRWRQRVQFYRWQALWQLCGGSIPSDDVLDQQPRVNLHDLTSRIEKLEDPNSATKYPCLCDPDCLCASLCAGEPDEDCLCETNPLFWRVTTGFEIEELLHRAKDELYPFRTRYNRLAQLTMGGLCSADIPSQSIITHASRLSIFADSSTFSWYRPSQQQSAKRTAG